MRRTPANNNVPKETPGPETNKHSSGPFSLWYRFCMSLERGKRKKKLLYAAGLGTGLVIGSQIPIEKEKPAEDPIARMIIADRGKFAQNDPRGDVEDRRGESEEIANALHFGELEPDPPINDDLATSELAKEAGAYQMSSQPRHTHSVRTWNNKNQIDHAIKKIQREVLLPKPDSHKKK